MSATSESQTQTPLLVIAQVSRVVTKVVDRIMGGRVDYPLMVAAAAAEGIAGFGIEARIMYGQAAWIELMEDGAIQWAGCWGENFSFWVATQFGEVVDLNTSVAYRKRAHSHPSLKAVASPPMLWAAEVPRFYRYLPEGIAELELTEAEDVRKYELVRAEVRAKCTPAALPSGPADAEPEFPNEPILCPGRRLLDDSNGSFKEFDRALRALEIPRAPF